MAKTKNTAGSEIKRVGKFGTVGIINTLTDFAVFNVLTQIFLFAAVPSNIVSTSCAMTISFFGNKIWVFGSHRRNVLKQAMIFIVVTLFGLWLIQTGIIYILRHVWTWPVDFGYGVVNFVGLDSFLSEKFVKDNGAKALATIFSLTWNYIMYKKVVFADAVAPKTSG